MSDAVAIDHPAFPAEEFQQRRGRLATAMAERGLAVLVVTAPEDVYYLTGYNNQGHFAFTALVVGTDGRPPVLVARAMEGPTAAVQVPDCGFAGYGDRSDPAVVLTDTIRQADGRPESVGYQPRSMTFPIAVWTRARDALASATWVDAGDLLIELRAVHTSREIACVRAAARLSDRGMRAALDAVGDGVSEAEVAAATLQAITSAGSDYPGFVPLVRPIARADQEHFAWSTRRLRAADDAVFVEMSAAVARYHAPLTRTVAIDKRPRNDAAADIARAGNAAIRAAIRPGRTADDVYRAWRRSVDAGLGVPNERHHCGYLIGIGFPPTWMGGAVRTLGPGNETVLRAGMTFYVQSWVIKQEVGDHVVCDTVLVTEDGCELLTETARE